MICVPLYRIWINPTFINGVYYSDSPLSLFAWKAGIPNNKILAPPPGRSHLAGSARARQPLDAPTLPPLPLRVSRACFFYHFSAEWFGGCSKRPAQAAESS